MWWCRFIDWLKFETRPSSLCNFGMANIQEAHPQFSQAPPTHAPWLAEL